MRIAVVTTLQHITPESKQCLLLQLQKLKKQKLRPYIALGIHNERRAELHFLSTEYDQVTYTYGDERLFQREAIRNKVVSELPKEIENVLFLDYRLYPESVDWIENCEKAFKKFNVFLPFHLVKDTKERELLKATAFFSSKGDPTLQWKGENLGDEALAVSKDLLLKAGGLPFEDGFTGYNGAREYFQLQSKQSISVPHFLGESQHRPYRREKTRRVITGFGFCLSSLVRMEDSTSIPSYRERVLLAFRSGWNIKDFIQLNPSGALDLKQSVSMELKAEVPTVEMYSIAAEELNTYTETCEKKSKKNALVPMTRNRAAYLLSNHHLKPKDIVLLLGKVDSRLGAFCHLLPGVLEVENKSLPVTYVYHAFVFHHLKPIGIVEKMLDYALSLNLNLMLCEEEPTLRRLPSLPNRIEIPMSLTFRVYKNILPQEEMQGIQIASRCEEVATESSHFLFDLKYEQLNIYHFTLRKHQVVESFQVTVSKAKCLDEPFCKIRILSHSLPASLTDWGIGAVSTYLDCPMVETTEELGNSECFELQETKKRSYILYSTMSELESKMLDFSKASLKLSDGGCPWS